MTKYEQFAVDLFGQIKSWLSPQFDVVLKRLDRVESENGELLKTIEELRDENKALAELLANIELQPGPPGADGRDGVDGKDGADGVDGKDGADGINGKDGENGKDGKDGKDGADGRDGIDGKDGRDALDLNILPRIDIGKSYPRNTYARHQGGIWRAVDVTDGMDGWKCEVPGWPEFDFDIDENAVVTMRCTSSTGEVKEQTARLPGLRHLFQFKRSEHMDHEFHIGDTVTYAGSTWHCNIEGLKGVAPDDKAEPINGKRPWTLMCKRGSDAPRRREG